MAHTQPELKLGEGICREKLRRMLRRKSYYPFYRYWSIEP
jgi:hypothetical protein